MGQKYPQKLLQRAILDQWIDLIGQLMEKGGD